MKTGAMKGFGFPAEPAQPSDYVKLTAAQHRELEKIAAELGGYSEGKGSEWMVRARLRSIGLLELRRIPEVRVGRRVIQHETNMWFITQAGRAFCPR